VVTQKGVKPRRDLGDARAEPDELRPLNDVSARELRQLAAHEAIRLARHQHAGIETPAWPEGKFRCVVIDPPWPVKKSERTARPHQGNTLDYPIMTLEEIAALPIADLAEPAGCHVYLWVPQRFVLDGSRLFEAWGVHSHCQLTWVKPTGMTPFSWQFNAEHVLFGWIGHLPILEKGHKITFEAPSIEHSTKPAVFYERVRAVSPGPRLELFARKAREGFQVWGHEVLTVSAGLAQS
jgi:N6-adenosine-specific RNA methylase IME4